MTINNIKLRMTSECSDTVLKDKAAIVDAAPDALISFIPTGMMTTWNQGATKLFGYDEGQAIGQSVSLLVEAGDEAEQKILIRAACDGNPVGPVEARYRRQDGKIVTVELLFKPILDDHSKVVALAAYIRDISARRRSDALRALIVDELSHRINNTIATVSAIASQSLNGATSLEAFGVAFTARLYSLSTTHTALARNAWRGTTLEKLIQAELAPYDTDDTRWTLSGVDLDLDSERAVALGMIVHELATNAVKYGALSAPGGHIDISWHAPTIGDMSRLNLVWTESRGPAVATPIRKGMGTRLLTDGLAAQLDGEVWLNFERTGVRCTIDIPLDAAKAWT
jgi:PAS domain S-box-containing protein